MLKTMKTLTKCIIVHEIGCPIDAVSSTMWYSWAEKAIKELMLFDKVILGDMPSPLGAPESEWIPFLKDELKADENTVVIGHATGAVAAMRLLEQIPLRGCVLVSACHTDQGDEDEQKTGYYSRPWLWDQMKKNVGSFGIHQFHSNDDPFIPVSEAEHVAKNTGSQY